MSNTKQKKKQHDLKHLLSNNRFLQVVSILVSVLLWLSIAMGEDNSITAVITDVPVDTSAISASVDSIGMDIVGGLGQTVSVRVEGRREVVGNLTASDIRVTPQIGESITDPGTYSLRLNAAKGNNLDSYEIVSVSPERINLTFDRVQSKKLAVEIDINTVSVNGSGLLLGEPTCSSKEIAIKGAQNVIDSVYRVVAKVENGGTIGKSTTFNAVLHYYDASGNEIKGAGQITADNENLTVVVPVLKEKSVELRVGFTNVPSYLNTDFIKYSLDYSAIQVAGPVDVIDSVQNITIGYLDLSKAQIGENVEFNIELPNGFVNRSSFEKVTLKMDSATYASKAFNVANFSFSGVPDGYTVSVMQPSVDGVNMMGLTGDITSLSAGELHMEVDVSAMGGPDGVIAEGERKVKANVVVSSGKTVWARGNYTVNIKVEKN
ncbi:MAG: hypothetical protein IIX77_06585 [Oscillospiraceae bacterium]|nr:hypothetical protein [Oscillospiraceae bacterium]